MHRITKSAYAGPFRGPLLVETQISGSALSDYIQQSHRELRDELTEHGALLFRGFSVRSVDDFNSAVSAFMNTRLEYTYRSTPRTSVGKDVFTATEFPKSLEIPLHSENAYQREWPMTVAFACMNPATSGGATPISSIRRASALMGASLLDMLTERKIKYVRHYRPYVDLPWQTVFQTSSRTDVETYCHDKGIEYAWLGDEILRTEQTCQGTAVHPTRGERLFFNQAHLFHVSSLGKEAAQSLIDLFGKDALPRNAFYGSGEELDVSVLDQIRGALAKEAVDIEWRQGDVLILDNMQFAHGRRTFSGDRKIIVALGEPYGASHRNQLDVASTQQA